MNRLLLLAALGLTLVLSSGCEAPPQQTPEQAYETAFDHLNAGRKAYALNRLRSAASRGHGRALWILARDCGGDNDLPKVPLFQAAEKRMKEEVRQGDTKSASFLGFTYFFGQRIHYYTDAQRKWQHEVLMQDRAEGRRLLQWASDQGDTSAMIALGITYQMDRDTARAAEAFTRAMEAGSGAGAMKLGDLAFNGGSTEDLVMAFRYYRRAEQLGETQGRSRQQDLIQDLKTTRANGRVAPRVFLRALEAEGLI